MATEDTIAELEQNLNEFRLSLESHRFESIDKFLRQQRELIEQLDFSQPKSRALVEQAHQLTRWAVTFMQIQHAHAGQGLASLLKAKQLNSGYLERGSRSRDLLNICG